MPIHFAAARHAALSPVARILARSPIPPAANDNGEMKIGVLSPATLAALKHFSQHGLAAAQIAHRRARIAQAHRDEADFTHWRDLCRILDRRLASSLPVAI